MKKLSIIAIAVVGGWCLSQSQSGVHSLVGFLLLTIAAVLFCDYVPSTSPEMMEEANVYDDL